MMYHKGLNYENLKDIKIPKWFVVCCFMIIALEFAVLIAFISLVFDNITHL